MWYRSTKPFIGIINTSVLVTSRLRDVNLIREGVLVSYAAVANYHKLGGTTQIYYNIHLQVESPTWVLGS